MTCEPFPTRTFPKIDAVSCGVNNRPLITHTNYSGYEYSIFLGYLIRSRPIEFAFKDNRVQ